MHSRDRGVTANLMLGPGGHMKRRIGSSGAGCVVRSATLPLLLVLCAPTHAAGQRATSVDSGRTTHTASEAFHPEFHKWREIILSGVGAGSLATGLLLHVDFRDVPAQGLDPADIPWSLDRSVVGNIDLDAVGASNAFAGPEASEAH